MPTTDPTPRGSTAVSGKAFRVAASWVLVAVLTATGLSIATSQPAEASPSAMAGACTTGDGVTVIVDYQGLGGGTDVYCAPNGPGSGLAALQQAGVPYRTALRAGGFVCQINGKPASDPCVVESPVDAYWSYWLAPRGGDWCFSNLGAAGRMPPAGTVEGWSFSLNNTASQTPPPRLPPPPAMAGVAPNPIPASHCTAPNRGTSPTTTPPAPQPTAPPATRAPSASGPAGSGSSGSSTNGGGQPGGTPGGGTGTAKPGSPTKPGNETGSGGSPRPGETNNQGPGGSNAPKDANGPGGKPSKSGTDTPGKDSDGGAGVAGQKGTSDDDATDPGDDPSAAEEATARSADQRFQKELEAINAREDRGAAKSANDDGGSPLPLIFAAVAVAALLGIGIRASRRNRAAS